jgi:hypothetical protein
VDRPTIQMPASTCRRFPCEHRQATGRISA